MTIEEMREWSKDKPGESIILHRIDIEKEMVELTFVDIGLRHFKRIRVDPNGEQGELFNDR